MMPEVKTVLGAIVCSTCENCIEQVCDMYCTNMYDAIKTCKAEKFKYYMKKVKPVRKALNYTK